MQRDCVCVCMCVYEMKKKIYIVTFMCELYTFMFDHPLYRPSFSCVCMSYNEIMWLKRVRKVRCSVIDLCACKRSVFLSAVMLPVYMHLFPSDRLGWVWVCGGDWVFRPSLCFTQHIHQKQRNAVKAQCVLHSAVFTLTSIVALQGIWTLSLLLWITLTFTNLYSLFPFLTTFLQSTTFPPKLIQSPRQITLGTHNQWLNQYL